ncbi:MULTISPECIES: DUF2497 domain-containing protein [Sphingomonadaceae]|jgi:cell pole-organizing protein PopZ|uniref:DUF2497 domain-containing protein n=1 Tax=Novosphingobium resinovorum TaxID=158500 RepID=A0A1D8A6G8_9SPHN|nr:MULTISPECIES: DUF2497 domain-containing protein [Sphingomonadaceae]AOR77691.1 hypothetical protein BES08_13690 [Novosphingobium resinovorum]EJU11721.1 hypothetical protein LH128_17472 [Sphingomonas sp. LH128]MBF7013141.1 DUF2497 domain-containing protein [Novosphingobium sp. HR1a]WJM27868.1 DUF2497 domain-containing protein [Novosphingobium resinovorum]GLK44370.1 hypothetical protein GCM10017612_22900 [Novosphingobium resinovorum]
MRQNGEPSVEEILQSIKQVIARDSRLETRTSRTERLMREPEPLYADEDEDDVLELQEASQITAAGETDEGPLLHDQARDSMRESLAALAMLSEPGAQPQIVRSGETSLEALAKELLRPALTEWLDRNLPAMVERLVAAEIARIVGKKG